MIFYTTMKASDYHGDHLLVHIAQIERKMLNISANLARKEIAEMDRILALQYQSDGMGI